MNEPDVRLIESRTHIQGLISEACQASVRTERARIHRELKVEIFAVFEKLVAQAVPGDLHIIEGALLAALDRIVPASEGKAWLVGDRPEDAGIVCGRRVVPEIDRICPTEPEGKE